jgi:tripartite-type tricarboxylate transporter receptor subunit TctC
MEFDGGWFAMFGPANMPETLLNKIHSEVRAALSTTTVRERFDAMGLVSLGTSPAEFRPFLESQVKAYAEMIKLAGVDPE